MSTPIQVQPALTIVDIQRGGPGNPWETAYIGNQTKMTAPSGGGVSVESQWGRAPEGGTMFLDSVISSNPERVTGSVMARMELENFLNQMKLMNCKASLRTRYLCDDPTSINNYQAIIAAFDAVATSRTFSKDIAVYESPDAANFERQVDYSAAFEVGFKPVTLEDISGTHSDAAINKVIGVSTNRCSGNCGDEQTDEDEFWVVTDRDSTPGYIGTDTPKFGFTTDGGATWTFRDIDIFIGADATDIAKHGDYVLVVSPTKGVAYALITDAKSAVNPVWTLASGISANHPKRLAVLPGGDVIAAGDGGYSYKSTDGGFSFSSLDAASATTDNINAIEVVSDNLVWFGCDSGTLLKYNGKVVSVVTTNNTDDNGIVTDITANINTLAVPRNRTKQLYMGMADGTVQRTNDSTVSAPVFKTKTWAGSGVGSVADLKFAGALHNTLYIVQDNAAGASRVIRDLSGGALGNQAEEISTYASPGNGGINSIAAGNENFMMAVGEVEGGQALIAQVTPVAV